MKTFSCATDPLGEGISLIAASAGTGKTHAITRIVLRLLVEEYVSDPTRILVVTYTEAAAAELSGRIRDVLAAAYAIAQGQPASDKNADLAGIISAGGPKTEIILRDAVARADEIPVSTIHGFCLQVLQLHAFEARMSLQTDMLTDDSSALRTALGDAWRAAMYPRPELANISLATGRSFDSTLKDLQQWLPHHQATLTPDTPVLDQAVAEVIAAAQSAAKAYTASAEACLRDGKWKADCCIKKLGIDVVTEALGHLSLTATDTRWHQAVSLARQFHRAAIEELHFKKPAPPDDPFFDTCTILHQALDQADAALRLSLLRDTQRRYQQQKNRSDTLSFDDLLTRLRDSLCDPDLGPALTAAIRQRWPVALVDEFQDTDPVQCTILEKAWPQGPLWLIGDPKQAIYAFRGADLFAYLQATERAHIKASLATNWRSTAALVDGVNALFEHANPFLDPRVQAEPVTAAGKADSEDNRLHDADSQPITWWLAESQHDITTQTVAEIARLLAHSTLGKRRLTASDCAILVRTNSQGEALRLALQAQGIPAVTAGGGNILTSLEAEDLGTILAATLEPGNPRRLRAAAATRLMGCTPAELAHYAEDDQAWLDLANQVDAWHRIFMQDGVHAVIEHLLDHEGWAERLLRGPDGERQVTNVRHLAELLHEAATSQRLSPRSLLSWFERAADSDALSKDERELRLESDADAVQIITVHRSKGLEFPIVFCPYVGYMRKPNKGLTVAHTADGDVLASWDPDANLGELADHERLSEDLRLLYVALTRASQRLFLGVCTADKQLGRTALAWLMANQDGSLTPTAVANLSTAEIGAAVEARALAAEQAVLQLTGPSEPSANPAPAADDNAEILTSRVLILDPHRLMPRPTNSFTSMVHAAERDRDHADPGVPLPVLTRSGPLDQLPAGARIGTALHNVLEHIPWQEPVGADALTAALRGVAVEPEPYIPALMTALERLRATPWPISGVCPAQTTREQRWGEWSFLLPSIPITGHALAEACEQHGDARTRAYAPCLRTLHPYAARGFLTGSIDFLVESDGKYWLADWKSNRLASYDDDALTQAMHDHHYVLQALLYLTALHRHLRSRLADYDPEEHLGGAQYIFLRGLDEAEGGFWTLQPPIALIEALDVLIGEAVAV